MLIIKFTCYFIAKELDKCERGVTKAEHYHILRSKLGASLVASSFINVLVIFA